MIPMNSVLSTRAIQIEASATMAVGAKAKELSSQGHDVINLGMGEPDFDTPEVIKAAATKAIRDGKTKYTMVDGIEPLKAAIVYKLKRDNQLSYDLNQILVSDGVKQGIYNLCQAVLNPGDEVMIPAPYWVSYPPIVKLAEAQPVIIAADIKQRFKMTPAQLEATITPKTRLLFLNSPSNPSGMAYTADELKALGNVLIKHPHILIATDDIYEYILWSQKFVTLLNVCPELKDRTIVFNGVSKAYAMTGWRIGYAAGPVEIIQGMKKIQSQVTTCASSISQAAAAAALAMDPNDLRYMLDAFKERHDIVYNAIHPIQAVPCLKSDGTFYSFIDVSAVIKRLGLKSDIDFATYLLKEVNVALVPGTAFGSPGHLRITFALGKERLQEALDRMVPIFSK